MNRKLQMRPARIFSLLAMASLLACLNGQTSKGTANPSTLGALPNTLINSIVVDPADPMTMYAGVYGRNVYKSTNGGAGWHPVNFASSAGNMNITNLALDPLSPDTLFAVTWDGVYKTTDGGETWINTLPDGGVFRMAIDPITTTIVYAGGGGVLYKSIDGGDSWADTSLSHEITRCTVTTIAINPLLPSTLYAATNSQGIYQSLDSGGTWGAVSDGLTDLIIQDLAVDPISPNILYAATYQAGVYKTEDGGGHWFAVNTGIPSGMLLRVIAVDPLTPNILYAGTYTHGVYQSIDAGVSWNVLNDGLMDKDVFSLTFSPSSSTIFAGTSDGIYRSAISGTRWSNTNYGLTSVFVYSLAIDPSAPNVRYEGTTTGVYKTTDGGESGVLINNGLSNWLMHALVIDPLTPATVYAGSENGIYKSTTGGSSWSLMGLKDTIVNALVLNPLAPGTIYAGTDSGLYKSKNGGVNWTMLEGGMPAYSRITSLAIDPKHPAKLYAGGNGCTIYKSTDSGKTWNVVYQGVWNCQGIKLAIDPTDASRIYAATNDDVWHCCLNGYWIRSIDGGLHWDIIYSNGFGLDLAVIVDPLLPTSLYIVDNGQVKRSLDGGGTWEPVDGIIYTIYDWAFAPQKAGPGYALYAGAWGLGIVRIPVRDRVFLPLAVAAP